MRTVLILLDSLNRNYLPAYGNDWVRSPNTSRLAEQSVVFDNHWIGSAPCMPARRDLLTGRLHFLERDWGGLEPFDVPLPRLLRQAGVFAHLETDHYHYFHVGGENYHSAFSTWRLHRGQENDVWVSRVEDLPEPEHLGQWGQQYAKNRTAMRTDADFPTPRTFQGAINWLQANGSRDDWFLWVEGFDPHEPFDAPEEFLAPYGDDYRGPLYNWSGYGRVADGQDAAHRHLRRRYAATLSMADQWLGRLLDELERQGRMQDTLIIFTTDHGHMLGERNLTGKNRWHCWNQLAHIPLLVRLPGGAHAGERRSQLTQNVDLFPTVLDYHGIPFANPVHGESWRPMIEANAPARRRAALYGWHGQTVNVTDGRHTYLRAPARADNRPLLRYFLTPSAYHQHDVCGQEFYQGAELGRFLPWTDCPVLRAPRGCPRSPDWADTRLHRLADDYAQERNLAGTALEETCEQVLVEAMRIHDAPVEQYERLGLARGQR